MPSSPRGLVHENVDPKGYASYPEALTLLAPTGVSYNAAYPVPKANFSDISATDFEEINMLMVAIKNFIRAEIKYVGLSKTL